MVLKKTNQSQSNFFSNYYIPYYLHVTEGQSINHTPVPETLLYQKVVLTTKTYGKKHTSVLKINWCKYNDKSQENVVNEILKYLDCLITLFIAIGPRYFCSSYGLKPEARNT